MIYVIGVGLDGKEGLSEKVRQILDSADVLLGSERHLSYFTDLNCEKWMYWDLKTVLQQLKEMIDRHSLTIVILTSGDPLFFGLGRLLLETFSPKDLTFYPHITSIQLAFSAIKKPWQDCKSISLHGRTMEELIKGLQQGIEKFALLTDSINHPPAIAQLILSLDVSYDVYIAENLGGDQEKISFFSHENLIQLSKLEGTYFSWLNVVILVKNQQKNKTIDLEKLPLLGIADSLFENFPDKPNLITKKEVRVLILAELALENNQVIWDIGAGTGSVSIEIARLTHSTIYAIEKTAMGIKLIENNSCKFGVNSIIPIYGKAPEILDHLPAPHRIFIGGSGGNLETILSYCSRKLVKQGKIVLALATLEHLNLAITWFKSHHWDYKLLQVNVSRSIQFNHLTRYSPLNPVTIIVGYQNE